MGSKIKKTRLAVVLLAIAAVPAALLACGLDRPHAEDGSGSRNFLRSGPCSPEGAVEPCHATTGQSGSVVSCVVGTQTCTNGVWSECGGTDVSFTSVDVGANANAVGGGQLGIQTVTASDASADAGACQADPCNPDCMGIDVDADTLRPDGAITSQTVLGDTNQWGSFPTAKQGASAQTCTPGDPPTDYNLCSYDYCCVPTSAGADSGTCQPWFQDAGAGGCTPAPNVDYTVGVGCLDANGGVHIPVCNRGTTDALTGKLLVAGYPSNPNQAGSISVCDNPANSTPAEGCTVDLAVKPLKAGTCIGIDVSAAVAGKQAGVKCNSTTDFSNGNRTTMVNPPNTTFQKLGNVASGSYTTLAESDKCNNYSFVFTQIASCSTYGGTPPPSTTTYDYKATCPVGTRVQWDKIGWRATAPDSSEITWSVQTAPALKDGGTPTFGTPIQVGDVKSDGTADPAACAIGSGVGGCPKSLKTALGKQASNANLRLSVLLTSNTAMPSVTSWQVTYSCPSYE